SFLLIFLFVLFSFLFHLFNLFICQTNRSRDGYVLAFTRCFILGCYFQNSGSINVKCHFYLWHASWCRRNAFQNKPSQALIVCCHWTLPLNNVHLNLCLIIGRSREHLGLLCRNCRV